MKNSRMFFIANFFLEIYRKRKLIFDLSVREFKGSYFGSTLGITWIFIEPSVYMFVMWFFFTKALKFSPPGNYPYLPWLFCSMVMWMFFSSGTISVSSVFSSYSYLLKKPEFNMSILPIVTILSNFYVHLIFLGLLIVILFLSNVPFSLFWFQSIYYLFATFVLLIGLAWLTASINLFVKDIKNVLSVTMQIGYWVSPIFWDIESYPEKYQYLMKLNPFYYIIYGYRQSFLNQKFFWDDMNSMIYYWSFTFIVLSMGLFTYKKLRPQFGDVV